MPSDVDHKPYISAKEILPEITIQGIILAILLGFLLTAANVYLGLYVGMTVSASIPAAVYLWQFSEVYRRLISQKEQIF